MLYRQLYHKNTTSSHIPLSPTKVHPVSPHQHPSKHQPYPILTSVRVYIVKKFDNTGEDLEDLISIGTIGLIKAIESFQPNKGTKLATFAARCIENEILMHLRSLKKTRKDVSLHDPIGTDKEGNEITLQDILGTEPDEVVEKVQLKIEKSKIYRNLDILDEREQEVIRGRFGLDGGGDERTQREIAREQTIKEDGQHNE